jgi:hypothetical protein
LIVVFLARRLDLDTVGNDGRAVRVASTVDRLIQIFGNLRWLELISSLVNRDLDMAVFQIDDAANRIAKGQIAETLRRGSH